MTSVEPGWARSDGTGHAEEGSRQPLDLLLNASVGERVALVVDVLLALDNSNIFELMSDSISLYQCIACLLAKLDERQTCDGDPLNIKGTGEQKEKVKEHLAMTVGGWELLAFARAAKDVRQSKNCSAGGFLAAMTTESLSSMA